MTKTYEDGLEEALVVVGSFQSEARNFIRRLLHGQSLAYISSGYALNYEALIINPYKAVYRYILKHNYRVKSCEEINKKRYSVKFNCNGYIIDLVNRNK